MHAVVIHATGGPEVLSYEEMPQPEPGDGEVLIRVHAASVNPVDWKQRERLPADRLPAVLGRDVSGTVEVSRAKGFAEGDAVFGIAGTGGYAEFAASPAGVVAHKPETVTHEQAASIPVAGLTAWQGLFDLGGLTAGHAALIAGGAGGVGHFAVQFARHAGARTTATGSARNRDFVLGLGADQYVDYTDQEVADVVSDVDVALDTVGGDTPATLLPAVRKGGILLGVAGGLPEEAAQARGVRTRGYRSDANGDQFAQIAALVAGGDVRVEIAEVLPLAEARRAQEISAAGHVRGKLVLRVAS